MAQMGFFDLSDRYASLYAKKDLLADFHLVHVSVCTGLVIPKRSASRSFVPREVDLLTYKHRATRRLRQDGSYVRSDEYLGDLGMVDVAVFLSDIRHDSSDDHVVCRPWRGHISTLPSRSFPLGQRRNVP